MVQLILLSKKWRLFLKLMRVQKMSTWEEITLPHNFNKFPVVILNGSYLMVKNQSHRICEIELYYYSSTHLDEYVHRDELQLTFGQIYFHRFKNGSYKGGTFRGADFTFGRSDVYLSILIRTLQTPTREIITGPCNVVNYLLKFLGHDTIASLVSVIGSLSILKPNHVLYLQPLSECTSERIYSGPRVGLSDKYPTFKILPYRFVSDRALKEIKKQKKQLAKFWGNLHSAQ
jgi:hypothetical protein